MLRIGYKRKQSPTSYAFVAKKSRKSARVSAKNTGVAQKIRGRYTLGNTKPEQKFYDETGNNNSFTTGATAIVYPLLDNLAQAVTVTGRLGGKVNLKSLSYKINWSTNSTAGTQVRPQVMIAFVLDKQPDGAAATFADIFTSIPGNDNLVQKNNTNRDRFQVLKSYSMVSSDWFLGQNPSSTSSYATAHTEFYIPLDIVSRFADGTGNPATNNLLAVFSTNATTNSIITIDAAYSRIMFTDV